MSKAQLKRDSRAILTVLGQHDGPVLVQQIYLQAGEGLGEAIRNLLQTGVVRELWGERGRLLERVVEQAI